MMADRPETAYVRSNGQVTLPVHVRRAAELAEGDIVEVVLQDDGTILLRPVMVLDRSQEDLFSRTGQRQTPALDEAGPRERARELVRRRHLPLPTGRRLDALVDRYERGELTRKAFIDEAIILGLPAGSIAAIVADPPRRELDATPQDSRAGKSPGGPARPHTVRIVQAVQSLLYLPLYIAYDVGFFDDEGLDVQITTAGGGPEAWSAVESGLAEYSIHDPVFAVRALERGVEDACVVGAICNGQAILALARDPAIEPTEDPQVFITESVSGRTVSTQPEPDSQWALLRFVRFLYQAGEKSAYRNLQVPIGTEHLPVLDGRADICLTFPPQAEIGIAEGLHEVFDFSRFFGPYLLSALATRRGVIRANPKVHEAVLFALEKACQYAHAFPEEVVRIAQREFPHIDPHVAAQAARRCLRRDFLPAHVAVDAEAWRQNSVLNTFVETTRQYRSIGEAVDNQAAFHAYRTLGNLRTTWDEPRPITRVVSADGMTSPLRSDTGPSR
jgi:AbrB family looped-hinge helix DNA binding protein